MQNWIGKILYVFKMYIWGGPPKKQNLLENVYIFLHVKL